MEKKLSKFNERFIENSDKGYFLEVDVEYPNKVVQRTSTQSSQRFTTFI